TLRRPSATRFSVVVSETVLGSRLTLMRLRETRDVEGDGDGMSDIKLFRVAAGAPVSELATQSPQVEKSLQNLFEKNLEALLGVRFLATEYSTGPVHGGRI